MQAQSKALQPLSKKDARAMASDLPLWTCSAAELESWAPNRLLTEVQRTVQHEKGFPVELARRLDDVFLVKTFKLLRSTHATAADFRALDLVVGSIAGDEVQADLERMPERFGSRWKVLSDLMSVAMKLREAEQATSARSTVSAHVWELVAEAMLCAGDVQLPWGEIGKVIEGAPDGPKSKGGISQLLTSMQAKGWIESITRGRNKLFFVGPKIVESQAWRKRNLPRQEPQTASAYSLLELDPSKPTMVANAVQMLRQKRAKIDADVLLLPEGSEKTQASRHQAKPLSSRSQKIGKPERAGSSV